MDTLDIIRQIEQDEGLRAQLRSVLLGDELLSLPARVAEMDLRLTTRLDQLTDKIADLAEGQGTLRSEVGTLSEKVADFAQGQAALRSEVGTLSEKVADFAQGQAALRSEVGTLSAVVGGGVEQDAAAGVEMVALDRGWTLHGEPMTVDLGESEVDVLASAEDGNGQTVTFVVEAKVRLRPADVRRFHTSLAGLVSRLGLTGTILPYCYGMRIYDRADALAEDLGIGLLTWNAEPVKPRPYAA